jgi:hypothetical protein
MYFSACFVGQEAGCSAFDTFNSWEGETNQGCHVETIGDRTLESKLIAYAQELLIRAEEDTALLCVYPSEGSNIYIAVHKDFVTNAFSDKGRARDTLHKKLGRSFPESTGKRTPPHGDALTQVSRISGRGGL